MAKRYYERAELYAGKEMRDRMEYDASMMIREDKSATANLPQNVVMREYPKGPYAMHDLPDTLTGVDVQMRDDSKHQKAGKYPEKY